VSAVPATSPDSEARYAPIGDYAIIGDGRALALVSRAGSIDWLCLPDFHSPPILAALLDYQSGGRLSLAPAASYRTTRRYVDSTPVLETDFETDGGRVRVCYFMPLPLDGLSRLEPERQIALVAEGLEGEVDVVLTFAPRFDYGSVVPEMRRRGKLGWFFGAGSDFMLFQTDFEGQQATHGVLTAQARLRAGERRYASLSFTRRDIGVIPALGEEIDDKRAQTIEWWRRWTGRCDYDGPFVDAVKRSLVTLRLLNFTQSGAVIAAATSSLPEAIGGWRNWDYRFCWLRDSSFILRSFIDLGYDEEAGAFIDWLMHATNLTKPKLQTLYDVYGETDLGENDISTLEGYRGSAPVRSGNGAADQLQLDVYGAVITAAREYVERGGELAWDERRRIAGFAPVVTELWRLPDNGIWEMRGGRRHTTYSKVMCWSALDGLIALTDRGVLDLDRNALSAEREVIRRTIEREAWNEGLGAYAGAFGHDYLDASLLLMPRIGFLDANDPRMRATYDRIVERLSEGPFVRRYAPGIDGFPHKEGAFIACCFWRVEHLAQRGDLEEAKELMRTLLDAGNDLGLFSEEIDPKSSELLGNFPQAFSHAGIIVVALAIRACEKAKKEDQ
jgi:GH15 family glucan-1,4-alpha-glucosidase